MKKFFSYAMPLAVMLCTFLLFSCHSDLKMPETPDEKFPTNSSSKKGNSSSSVQQDSSSSENLDSSSSN